MEQEGAGQKSDEGVELGYPELANEQKHDASNRFLDGQGDTWVGDNDNIYINIFKALYVSLCFFILFSAFNSTQNLSSEVQKENGLESFGFVLISILYLLGAFGSFFSSAIQKKIGSK